MATADSERPLVGGKYQLLGRLGAGGMGEVWEARHEITGRRVAVKLLRLGATTRRDEASKRFLREAQAIGRVEHPHVVEVLDAGIDPARKAPYIVQSLLRGVSLRGYLKAHGRLTAEEAARVVAPILRGLGAAHVAGIVHRDVKPSNVILCRQPDDPLDAVVPKLIDFGISKLEDEPEGDTLSTLTASGVALGTVGYMAPEQIEGRELDGRADLWSVGVMLFEMVAGRRPFDGASTAQTLVRSLTVEAPSLRSFDLPLPPAFPDVVARALATSPAHRFLSALEMLDALASAVGEPLREGAVVLPGASVASAAPRSEIDDPHPPTAETAPARVATPTSAELPPSRMRTPALAVAGIAAIAIGGAAGLAWRPGGADDPTTPGTVAAEVAGPPSRDAGAPWSGHAAGPSAALRDGPGERPDAGAGDAPDAGAGEAPVVRTRGASRDGGRGARTRDDEPTRDDADEGPRVGANGSVILGAD
jgi:hypothetical protein